MASRSGKPEPRSLHEKFKQWFKGKHHHPSHGTGTSSQHSSSQGTRQQIQEELILDPETLCELSSESSLQTRVKMMKELTVAVRERRLQEHGVELLWMKTKDLVENPDSSVRHSTLFFYVSLVSGHYRKLEVMRAQFFRAVEHHVNEVDLEPALLLLDALTKEGKEILHFEEKIGPVLFKMFPLLIGRDHLSEFLLILLNMIKFNPAYLDAEVVCGLIGYIEQTCMAASKDKKNTELCLQCLYAIMGYSYVPKEALTIFICTLCRVVNIQDHSSEAWRIMENLMATHLSHSALYNLCQITQLKEYQRDIPLVRGAIFFVGKSLWGSRNVKTLQDYSAMTILPTFIRALECEHHLITYEVTRQLERLILKKGGELRAPGCDCALDLIEAILATIPMHDDESVRKEIYGHIHTTISQLEVLSEEKLYRGSKKKLYDIIDLCAKDRPESSLIRLISYRANGLYPTKPAWINGLQDLMNKYFKCDFHEAVRIKTLQVMMDLVKSNRHMYEEELLERIVIPFLKKLDDEPMLSVKIEGLKVLTSICCECSSAKSLGLIDIFERVLNKPLEKKETFSWTDDLGSDVKTAVSGLIRIFETKLYRPPSIFIERIYNILSQHLEDNYRYPNVFSGSGRIRLEIFKLFLALRSDENFYLGFYNEETGVVKFSPFVVCRMEHKSSDQSKVRSRWPSGGQQQQVLTYLSLTRACKLVIQTLMDERDWQVLKMVLAKVPTILQNKAIITKYAKDIHQFVNPLIELTSRNNGYPENLSNTPSNFSRTEFHKHVFPVLAAMASYSEFLESQSQRCLITALHNGLLSRECSRICIVALTACALEMKKQMYHLIPQVLLNFSKISATKLIATPMLEFLSTLIRLPDIFSSFTDTNYMSVFAIALPFTNPFKFDPYTVSLAHHIIIMWFLKCRLAYRQNFVQFIITGLNSNVIQSFEDGGAIRKSVNTSQASKMKSDQISDAIRKRSSSLTDNTLKLRSRHNTGVTARTSSNKDKEMNPEQIKLNKMILFHQELTETCVDILARYMFANSSVLPKRLPATKFLLQNGNSATWLLNKMLITVTTSHCDLNSSRGGLCDRCHLICSKCERQTVNPMISSEKGDEETTLSGSLAAAERKGHQSEFQTQRSSPSRYIPGASAKDEYDMRRQLSFEALQQGDTKTNPNQEGDQQQQPGESVQEKGKAEALIDEQIKNSQKKPELCGCWCTGWAEVHVRRPSGDASWMCRIQNTSLISDSHIEIPLLSDLSSLMKATLGSSEQQQQQQQRKNSSLVNSNSESIELLTGEQNGTCSIFHRLSMNSNHSPTKDGSALTTLSPKSPVKKTPSFPDIPDGDENPEKVEDSVDGKKSCDPIIEQEEDACSSPSQSHEELKRRVSLQPITTSASDTHLVRQISSNSPMRSREPSGTPPTPSGTSGIPLRIRAAGNSSEISASVGGVRDRAHTVSGPSPRKTAAGLIRRGPEFLRSQTSASSLQTGGGGPGDRGGTERVTGISPQFVFLQLFHNSSFGSMDHGGEKPLLLPATKMMEASIRNLDRIHAHETHKIGVLYIGPGQHEDETAILLNEFGSMRYMQFLNGLGSLISLKEADKSCTYLGGLDYSDGDGDFTYMWEDDVMQMVFHIATLMPNHEKDPKANKKKRHIGNDFVAIVYNDSIGGNYKLGTVKGQFIYACVVVIPLDLGSNKVFIECRPELNEPLGHVKEPKIVSDRNLAILVRQLALHCNLAAQIQKSLSSASGDPYSSNCLERLRQIKRIKDKLTNEVANHNKKDEQRGQQHQTTNNLNDFTSLVLRKRED